MKGKPEQIQIDAFKHILDVLASYIDSDNIPSIHRETGISITILHSIKKYSLSKKYHRLYLRSATIGAIFILLWYYGIDINDLIYSVMFGRPFYYNINQYYMRSISRWYTNLLEYRKTNDMSMLNNIISEMSQSIEKNPINGAKNGSIQRLCDTGD